MIRPVGDRALLVELPDLPTVLRWHAALTEAPLRGQVEAIAAARTVLIAFDAPSTAGAAVRRLAEFSPPATATRHTREVTIDVVYDGADLAEAAQLAGMSPEALVAWHTGTSFSGAFGGFAPGFTYCVPTDPADALDMPRRRSPRTAVPPGAVGLAGGFTAVYPRESPGGWQLIGSTTTPLWDPARTPPSLIAPGDTVHYRAVTRHEPAPAPTTAPPSPSPALTLLDAGLITLIEDLGRPGFGDLGVTTSGAADRGAHRAANEAVGNAPGAATLENIGGLSLRAEAEVAVAVTGTGRAQVDGMPLPLGYPIVVPPGATLTVTAGTLGLRTYVAVRGGIEAPKTLGSRATDVLSGLGPEPLAAGAGVALASDVSGTAAGRVANPAPAGDAVTLRCIPGPREDWIAGGALALAAATWRVSAQSNRVGLRLDGASPLARAREEELPSEGLVAGAVQVPGSGQPIVFLRDHPVTGGYPVVATVISDDLDAAAQLRPGDAVSFVLL